MVRTYVRRLTISSDRSCQSTNGVAVVHRVGPTRPCGVAHCDAGLAEQDAGKAAALGGVGEHVGEHTAEHEALGWVAQRVDQAVAPGATSLDVADEGEPAWRDGIESGGQLERVGVVGEPAGVVGALDRGQPDLVGAHAPVEQRRDRALRAGPAQQNQPG
jgi:hypothetical protein